MRIGQGGALLLLLLGALATGGGACHSPEPVIPFMDSGDPCSGSTTHAINCAQYADTTCVVSGAVCPQETYGCADAAYFTKEDYSQCPPEAGGNDAAQLGDVSLFGDDASGLTDAAPGDASGDSSDAPAD
jgi:hypothetical protein